MAAELSVQQFGGSLAAPGWGDISDWWSRIKRRAATSAPRGRRIEADYSFLSEVLSDVRTKETRRAEATLARHSDADTNQ